MTARIGAAPKILLTNDDGYDAGGLALLAEALTRSGCQVTVLAPDRNHSGRSHSVHTSAVPLRLTRRAIPLPETSWSCSGSPVDCVRAAILADLLPDFDLVVSGINHGANAGDDIHYSGTVGAAAEAALLGVPAIAVSQHGSEPDIPFLAGAPDSFPHIGYVVTLVHWVLRNELPTGGLLNLNLPHSDDSSRVVLCSVGRRDWTGARVETRALTPGRYHADMWAVEPEALAQRGSDFAELLCGHATITALSVLGGLHDALDLHQKHYSSLPLDLHLEYS